MVLFADAGLLEGGSCKAEGREHDLEMGGLGAQKVSSFARSRKRRFSLVSSKDVKGTESGWRRGEVKGQCKSFRYTHHSYMELI